MFWNNATFWAFELRQMLRQILGACSQRWFYIVMWLSSFRKVLFKSLHLSYYLCILLLFVLCLFKDFWFPIKVFLTDKFWTTAGKIFSARINLRPLLFHVYLLWLLWCELHEGFLLSCLVISWGDHAKITTDYLLLWNAFNFGTDPTD